MSTSDVQSASLLEPSKVRVHFSRTCLPTRSLIVYDSATTFDPKQHTIPTYDSKKWQAVTPVKQPSQRQKRTRGSTPSATPAPAPAQAFNQQQTPVAARPPQPTNTSGPHVTRAPLPTTPQALTTTYPSRLRTGATLLMQPILASTTNTGALGMSRTGTRRGGVVNYAEVGSDDDMAEPDAGEKEKDSDDSDFATRASVPIRPSRTRNANGFTQYTFGSPAPQAVQSKELDQSYLGQEPPSRFIKPKTAQATRHEYA